MVHCRRPLHRALAALLSTTPCIVGRRHVFPLTALSASALARQYASVGLPQKREEKNVSTVIGTAKKRALQKELQYLQDPFKLAEHVRHILRKDKNAEALELCRMASRTMECIVSWNLVIKWHIEHGNSNAAMRLYNEMKKRAQFPDSYTYALILSGLARKDVSHGQRQKNASKAVSIYTSMSSPTSRVKPRIRHTNAVLRVCSLAHDMDAIWGVISNIPQHGDDSADHITYSTLIHAIRHSVDDSGLGDKIALAKRRLRAVDDGKRVWMEVIPRWISGEVEIDDELVNAMGNLLLISPRLEDADSILDLVKQTMDVNRQILPVGSAERHLEHLQSQGAITSPIAGALYEDTDVGLQQAPVANAFRFHSIPSGQRSRAWVPPSNAILSVLIQACARMRTSKAAHAYWDIFTSRYNVMPDLANFHAKLELMSAVRASVQAANLVTVELAAAGVRANNHTFRLAMGICLRDTKQPRICELATSIVKVMQDVGSEPCLHVLVQYLKLACIDRTVKNVSTAVEVAQYAVEHVRATLDGAKTLSKDTATDVAAFLQSFISAIDKSSSSSEDVLPSGGPQSFRAVRAEAVKLRRRTASAYGGGTQEREDFRSRVDRAKMQKETVSEHGIDAPTKPTFRRSRRKGNEDWLAKRAGRAIAKAKGEMLLSYGEQSKTAADVLGPRPTALEAR